MFLQTDPVFLINAPWIDPYGCHFMSLLRIAELEARKDLTADQVENLYSQALTTESVLGDLDGVTTLMGENCFIRDPDAIVNLAFDALGAEKRLFQIGLKNETTGEENFWDTSNGTHQDWQILEWKTRKSQHFVLGNGFGGYEVYDPDPRSQAPGFRVALLARVYYQVRDFA